MTDDKMKKKRAAALAAVSAYIKTQEESAAALVGDDAGPRPQTPWGMSHRMDMMAMRNMMQMKVFHGVFK